jgi:hypothetical protein
MISDKEYDGEDRVVRQKGIVIQKKKDLNYVNAVSDEQKKRIERERVRREKERESERDREKKEERERGFNCTWHDLLNSCQNVIIITIISDVQN